MMVNQRWMMDEPSDLSSRQNAVAFLPVKETAQYEYAFESLKERGVLQILKTYVRFGFLDFGNWAQ